jgi:hypothetical protein
MWIWTPVWLTPTLVHFIRPFFTQQFFYEKKSKKNFRLFFFEKVDQTSFFILNLNMIIRFSQYSFFVSQQYF